MATPIRAVSVLRSTRRLYSSKMSSTPQVVFVLGGPGSGKGTQCEKIVKEFGFIHLSAGDLLRSERLSGSELGEQIEIYLKNGKIVPVSISLDLLKKAMSSKQLLNNDNNIFLIDGFPRNIDNLNGWDKFMNTKNDPGDNNYKILSVLFFTCSEKEMIKRLNHRSKTSGRSDDNVKIIQKRISIFNKETMPVIKILEERGLIQSIQADLNEEIVYESTRQAVIKSCMPEQS